MIKPIIDMTEKTVVIVGASSGIGRATAKMLSEVGARCVLIARNEAKLRDSVTELNGTNHLYYSFDLANVKEIKTLTTKIVECVGPIDGLAYCAGIPATQPIKNNTVDYLNDVMCVNFYSYYEMIRCISDKKSHNKPCRIVGVSSVGAAYPGKGQSVYSASKAAMDVATKALAVELFKKGIALNTVRPGGIYTDMYASFLEETGIDYMEPIKDRQFMGVGQAEDVASMIAYLISPAAKFVTGMNIAVDGGYTCH